MRRALLVMALAAALLGTPAHAWAGVLVTVDLARQQMSVDVDGKRQHTWSVSTARSDYITPTGNYRPQRMHKMWYSRKYDDAPMPHAIFYSGGYAIHGTTSVRMLGRPASHGCVRLAPANAAALFSIVQRKGMAATRIVIHGVPPRPQPAPRPALAQRQPQTIAVYRPTAAPLPPPASRGLLSGLFSAPAPAVHAPRRLVLARPARLAHAAPQQAPRHLRLLPASRR